MNLKGTFSGLVDKALSAGGHFNQEFNAVLDEYRGTVSILESCGFRVDKCKVSLGLLPKVHTTIRGSLDFLDITRLQGLPMTQNNRMFETLVGGLETVAKLGTVVDLKKLPDLRIHILLAVPPEISFEFADATDTL